MKPAPLIAIPVSKVLLDEAAKDPAVQAWLAQRAVELAEREKRVSVVRSATGRVKTNVPSNVTRRRSRRHW